VENKVKVTDSGNAALAHGLEQESFRPHRWLGNGHVQTLWRKFAPVPPVAYRRQRIDLADGDFIDLDWRDGDATAADSNPAGNNTIVLLLHGLCGCSRSSYIQSLQHQLGLAGYPSVAMNFRGCSGEVNRLARAYHSGVTDDLDQVLALLRQQFPGHQFALAGFSLGANVLLKWLGEAPRKEHISCAVAVSTPFDLLRCSTAMLEGLSRMYGRYFLRKLVADVEAKKRHFHHSGNQRQLELLRACGNLDELTSLWDFDDRITAPLHGFDDARDYYSSCSSIHFLPAIRTPTLLLQSLDDPIIPAATLPTTHLLPDQVRLDSSERGGHVGFASAVDRFWLEKRIVNFINHGHLALR